MPQGAFTHQPQGAFTHQPQGGFPFTTQQQQGAFPSNQYPLTTFQPASTKQTVLSAEAKAILMSRQVSRAESHFKDAEMLLNLHLANSSS